MVLKTTGLIALGGSNPSPSANIGESMKELKQEILKKIKAMDGVELTAFILALTLAVAALMFFATAGIIVLVAATSGGV